MSSKIKSYGYFDYAVNEALILSEEEQNELEHIFRQLDFGVFFPIRW